MAFENCHFYPPGEHARIAPQPADDPVTWPGAYVTSDRGGDVPTRIREMHEYWEPTVGPQWYTMPRKS